jgi:AcrR family transcriptional regulator
MSAAVKLIVEDGYAALTIERVAVRASVSRAALYRRWPNKVALVVDAIGAFAHNQVPLPDTGRLRDDITEFLRNMVRAREADLEAYEALSAALVANRELAERCKDTLVASFSASFRTIVTRAVDRGELPSGTDIQLLADLAPALARYRRQVSGERLDDAFIDRLADQFFTPARAAPTTPATGSERRRPVQQTTGQGRAMPRGRQAR